MNLSDELKSVFPQSAVIPYRWKDDVLQILLITNHSGKRWVLPKGLIEDHPNELESAVQEAFEEAGIQGDLDPVPIGHYQYKKWGGLCKVTIYNMKVEHILEEWPESFFRKRRWMDLDEVHRLADKRIPREVFKTFESKIV